MRLDLSTNETISLIEKKDKISLAKIRGHLQAEKAHDGRIAKEQYHVQDIRPGFKLRQRPRKGE
jgi:hypothetical protein